MRRIARDVEAVVVNLLAIFEQPADAAKGAAQHLHLQTLPEKTVLHLQADGAAERDEAEDGIIREYIGAVDRLRRNQVPVDGVAKSLVDADAILIDGKA